MKRPMLKIKDDDLVEFRRDGTPRTIHHPFNADGSYCPLYWMHHQYMGDRRRMIISAAELNQEFQQIGRMRIATSTNPSESLFTATRFIEIDPSTPIPGEDL